MVKLNIEAHKDAKDKLYDLKLCMDKERKNQLQLVDAVSKKSRGSTVDFLERLYSGMLETGEYDVIYKQVDDMYSILTESLPKLTSYKSVCNNFHVILDGSEPSAYGYSSGELMMNAGKILQVNGTIDNVLSNTRSIESALNSVISGVSDLVDFGDCQTRVSDSCRKIERLGTLKENLNTYKSNVSALDLDLYQKYSKYPKLGEEDISTDELSYTDELQKKIAIVEKYSNLFGKDNGMLEYIYKNYDSETLENACKLLEKDENGIYAFEYILNQDYVTENQLECLMALYNGAFDAFENSDNIDDCPTEKEVIGKITYYLYDVQLRSEHSFWGDRTHAYVVADNRKIRLLQQYAKGKYATSALENMLNGEVEISSKWFDKSWYQSTDSVTSLAEYESTLKYGINLAQTDLGVQLTVVAAPMASKRGEYPNDGVLIIKEQGWDELPFLEKCARDEYRMTADEEKEVEKQLKEYFKDKDNKTARDIADNFGIDLVQESTLVNFTPEQWKEFERMYLLYRKTDDIAAFSQGFYSHLIFTKPFMYGGIIDRKMGFPETSERHYYSVNKMQNPISYGAGCVTGEVTEQLIIGEAIGSTKVFTKAGESLAKFPGLNKIGAETISNVLAGTTVDVVVDTVPTMVEMGVDGNYSAIEIAKEGAGSLGKNLAFNAGSEAVIKVVKLGVNSVRAGAKSTDTYVEMVPWKEKDFAAIDKMTVSEKNVYYVALEREPGITEDLMVIVNRSGGTLTGLEYRVKSPSSIYEKMYERVEKTEITDMNDLIRYTQLNSGDDLVESMQNTLKQLEDSGYKVTKFKNSWPNATKPYKGVNVTLESVEGQKFELQFHTQESFNLKNGELHKLYEIQRVLDEGSERYLELEDEMLELSRQLEPPKNINTMTEWSK